MQATDGYGNRSPKERTRFWSGMAAAMAKQWGILQIASANLARRNGHEVRGMRK